MAIEIHYKKGWYNFDQSAYESLKYVGRANMDLLVCLSTTAAFVYSLIISIILLVGPSLVSGTNSNAHFKNKTYYNNSMLTAVI